MVYNYDDVVKAAMAACRKFAESGIFKKGGQGEIALIKAANGDFSGLTEVGFSAWLQTARANRNKDCAFQVASFMALLAVGKENNGKDTWNLGVEDYYLVDKYLDRE